MSLHKMFIEVDTSMKTSGFSKHLFKHKTNIIHNRPHFPDLMWHNTLQRTPQSKSNGEFCLCLPNKFVQGKLLFIGGASCS